MRTVTENIYKFEELSNDIQRKVIDEYLYHNIIDTQDMYEYDIESICDIVEKRYGVVLEKDSFSWDVTCNAVAFSHDFEYEELISLLDKFGITFDSYEEKMEFVATYPVTIHSSTYNTMYLEWNEYDIPDKFQEKEKEWEQKKKEFLTVLDKWKNTIAEYAYQLLNDTWEYVTSDEFVIDFIESNEVEFYKDGREYIS